MLSSRQLLNLDEFPTGVDHPLGEGVENMRDDVESQGRGRSAFVDMPVRIVDAVDVRLERRRSAHIFDLSLIYL